jgi:hypothetical protein
MAIKRIRKSEDVVTQEPTPTVPLTQTTDFEAILKRIQTLENQNVEKDQTIKDLTKKVLSAWNDISQEVKDSKRRYGYEMDGVTRRLDENFEYGYKVMLNDRKEKVVIKTETIGRPMESTNYNTGKKTYVHDVKVFFHDGSMIEIDALEFINQFYTKKQLVPDSDITVKDGVKQYTFRTEQFWTFTIAENFIN